MTCRVEDIVRIMEQIAPKEHAESWDNVGLLVGSYAAPVKKIMVCLDITLDTIDFAIDQGVNMIISHHPVIFKALAAINDKNIVAKRLLSLIRAGISVYSAHTNLDRARSGMDDALAQVLGLVDPRPLLAVAKGEPASFGRIGQLGQAMELKAYLQRLAKDLQTKRISFIGDERSKVKTIASCAGAGGDFLEDAIRAGADLFITGEMKHSELVACLDIQMPVAVLGHYETEMPGVASLIKHLQSLINSLQYNVEVIPANDYYNRVRVLEE